MAKVLILAGMVVSLLLVGLFGLDLAANFPFGLGGQRYMIDGIFVVCGLILAFMSWSTWREQT